MGPSAANPPSNHGGGGVYYAVLLKWAPGSYDFILNHHPNFQRKNDPSQQQQQHMTLPVESSLSYACHKACLCRRGCSGKRLRIFLLENSQ